MNSSKIDPAVASTQPPPPPGPLQGTILPGHRVFQDYPVRLICMNCRQEIVTEIHYQTGLLTWLIAGGVCLVGCCLGCCLIPFCLQSAKDVVHLCPHCQTLQGRYSRLS